MKTKTYKPALIRMNEGYSSGFNINKVMARKVIIPSQSDRVFFAHRSPCGYFTISDAQTGIKATAFGETKNLTEAISMADERIRYNLSLYKRPTTLTEHINTMLNKENIVPFISNLKRFA
jgi:hypothetical protein